MERSGPGERGRSMSSRQSEGELRDGGQELADGREAGVPLRSGGGLGVEFRLHHMGSAVPELRPAAEILISLFGYRIVSGPFDDPLQKVSVLFLGVSPEGGVELELVAPLTDDSPIRSILRKSGGGGYHACFETADLHLALEHARSRGCVVLGEPAAAVAFEGRRIAWIYTPARQLFELLESAKT